MFGSKGRARLEIELPTGISIVYDADHAAGKLPTRAELMARMRAAIGATDWVAVKALYGEDALVLGGVGGVQLGGQAATPAAATPQPKRQAPAKPPTVPGSGSAPADRTVVTSP